MKKLLQPRALDYEKTNGKIKLMDMYYTAMLNLQTAIKNISFNKMYKLLAR